MTSSPPIPLVLSGCGAVSRQFYLPALRALAPAYEYRVHSIVDPNPDARDILLSAFPHAQPADTLDSVSAPRDSLAVIATPPRLHAAQTHFAISRGWHVLCEKPMAATAAECDAMTTAAAAARRHLAVGLYKRFFPAAQYIKHAIARNTHGPLRHIDIAEGGPFRWPAATRSFFDKTQTPGGVLLDIGVHILDLLIWWLGEPARLRYADDAMGGLEINSIIDLAFSNNTTAHLRLSRDWPAAQRYRFDFERATLTWHVNASNALTLHPASAPSALAATLTDPQTAAPQSTQQQSFIAQLRNIAAAIRGETQLLVPATEGARSLRLIERCYREKTPLPQPWLETWKRSQDSGDRSQEKYTAAHQSPTP